MRPAVRTAAAGAGVAAVVALYALFAVHYHQNAAMAPDESFYAIAARDVYAGRTPYADFAYTQTPLYPYIDGLILRLTGTTLFAHRAVNAAWGLVTLLVVMWTVHRRTRALEPALLAGFLLAGSPRWVSLQALAVWCGPSGTFVAVAMAAALQRGPYWPRVAVFSAAAAAACGCRLTSALTVAGLALLFALEGGWRRRLLTAAVIATACVAPILPFALAAPERFLFDVWVYHVGNARPRNVRIQVGQWWNVAPAVITALAVTLLAVPRLVRARAKAELVLLATGLAGMTVPIAPPGAWGVYVTANVPVAAAAVTTVFSGLAERRSPARVTAWGILILPLFVLILPMSDTPPTGEVAEMAAFLRRGVPPGPLLTAIGAVAVEADRPIVPGTEMGPFSAMAAGDAERARRTGFTTLPALTRAVRERAPAAVLRLSKPEASLPWNFRWAVPSMEDQDSRDVEAFERAIEDCYGLGHQTETLDLYVRKERCDGEGEE